MNSAMFVSSVASVDLRQFFLLSFATLNAACRCVLFAIFCVAMAGCQQSASPPVESVELGPAAFSGSESCQNCHAEQYESWRDSHHALAMQVATTDSVVGDFSGIEFSYFDTTSTFFQRDDRFFVETQNANGVAEEFVVSYVFGVYPLQQYLIELPRGHVQPLTIAWDDRPENEGGQQWFHLYPDEYIGHDDELHWTGRTQNWNYMCAECHSTNLQKNYDLESDSFATNWSEINVGCEGCHGPASRHIELKESGNTAEMAGLQIDLDDAGRAVWEMNPETGIAQRSEFRMRPPAQPEACGRCHARRSILTEDYEFSQSLLDTHAPSLLDENLYFPDGQIREEVYVYGSFLQSRMYQAGVSCSDCHDPHTTKLKSGAEASDICSTCHLPQKFSTTEHHNHEPQAAACVDCHMPSRTYMGVDDRRDHSFRIPRPDLTVSTGSPNACNGCHVDKDADWAISAIDSWYGSERVEHFATAIHAGQTQAIGANNLLVAAARNEEFPGLARGTALAGLRGPYSSDTAVGIQEGLNSPDPFIRTGALRALPSLQPELRAQWGGPLLADPVRSVRIEAVRVIAPVVSLLNLQYGAAFRDAEIEFVKSQDAIEERPEAHINLGNHYTAMGDTAAAEVEFRTALRLEPRSAAARVNMADLYRQLNREDDALKVIRDGLVLNSEDAALRHSLGLLMVRGEQSEAALGELEAAATLQPENPRFVYVYGIALNSMGQAEKGIATLMSAYREFPADFDISWGLVTMLRDQGRLEEARNISEQMIERYPENESVRNLQQSL